MGYPEPEEARDDPAGTLPIAPALALGEDQPSGSRAPELALETPLAPQEVRQVPVIRIVAIVSAIVLGLAALWLRANV
jgi:hypothetical protein